MKIYEVINIIHLMDLNINNVYNIECALDCNTKSDRRIYCDFETYWEVHEILETIK